MHAPRTPHTPKQAGGRIDNLTDKYRSPGLASPASPPKGHPLRAALAEADVRDVVREVVALLMAKRSFGSPLTLLQQEYAKQLQDKVNADSAFYTRTTGTMEVEGLSFAEKKPTVTVGDLQEEHVRLHAEYVSVARKSIAKDEVITRLREKVTELQKLVHSLQHAAISSVNVVGPATTVRSDVVIQLEKLNEQLLQRCETLEHNMSLGLIFVEPELSRAIFDLQKENEALASTNAELSAAYLDAIGKLHETSDRAAVAEDTVATLTKECDFLRRELDRLRVLEARSKVDR